MAGRRIRRPRHDMFGRPIAGATSSPAVAEARGRRSPERRRRPLPAWLAPWLVPALVVVGVVLSALVAALVLLALALVAVALLLVTSRVGRSADEHELRANSGLSDYYGGGRHTRFARRERSPQSRRH